MPLWLGLVDDADGNSGLQQVQLASEKAARRGTPMMCLSIIYPCLAALCSQCSEMSEKLEQAEESAAQAKRNSESWPNAFQAATLERTCCLLHVADVEESFADALRKAEEDLKAKSEDC